MPLLILLAGLGPLALACCVGVALARRTRAWIGVTVGVALWAASFPALLLLGRHLPAIDAALRALYLTVES